MYKFSAEIAIIGVNPFVFVPNEILQHIFKQAGHDAHLAKNPPNIAVRRALFLIK